MDLQLSEEQELFLETTRRFLTARWPTAVVRAMIDDPVGVDRTLWRQGAALGWTSAVIPEDLGGGSVSGEGVRDMAIVAELLGRFLFPGPVVHTAVVADALVRAGTERLAKEHLPAIASGQEAAVWAVSPHDDHWATEARSLELEVTGSGLRLTGTKAPVQDAHVADVLLATARSSGGVTQVLVPVDAPGITVEVLGGLDLTRRYCRVHFDGVEVPATAVVGAMDEAARDLDRQLALALALQCAETVGATDRVYEMTLSYVKDRNAFGRPIGSYQALKHRLADMLLWLESAKAVADAAVRAVQTQRRALETARVAKSYIGERCPAIVRDCLQMHGGIGFTWEHDLHLYLRRVETDAIMYGGPDHQRDHLAAAIGLG